MKIDIGVDPDSNAHGVAVYQDAQLSQVLCLPTIKIIGLRQPMPESNHVTWHIEDVMKRDIVFGQKLTPNAMVNMKIAHGIGRCSQSQLELENLLKYFFPNDHIIHYGISDKWKDKDGKKEFKTLTGWTKRSNEDSRSAAYFGFLGTH